MAKRRPTKQTPRQRSTPAKLSRQERRQAARNDAKAQRTVATTPSGGCSRQDALALVALGLLVVVSYLPAMLWGGFVWDDNICIKVNPVRDVSGLWQIWFSPSAIEAEGHYWPLVYTTFWLEHKLWGFDPTGYHVVNVLLHLANTLLVWHLVRRLAVPGAWMVAAVFAVHPLHVESVEWVIERKDVLSGLFYLAAVRTMWMRFMEQPNPTAVCGVAGVICGGPAEQVHRGNAAGGPVALALVETKPRDLNRPAGGWCRSSPSDWSSRLATCRFIGLGEQLSFDYSFTERTLIAARALWFYAGKLLWPTNLAVIYPLWDIRVCRPAGLGVSRCRGIALTIALWHWRHRLGRGLLAGALFFAVTLSPVLGFVDYGYMQFAFVADRFQYLAGIGVMAVVIGAASYGVRRLPDLWQKGALVVAAVIIVVLGILTWRQASIYRDGETFYRHIIALNPQARNAHLNLGKNLEIQGRYEEALAAYRVDVEQHPNYEVHSRLGVVLNELGRFEEARNPPTPSHCPQPAITERPPQFRQGPTQTGSV